MSKSLCTKTGLTRVLTEKQTADMMAIGELHRGNVLIKFKTEKEGYILARKYIRLAKNPSIKLTVKFEKII